MSDKTYTGWTNYETWNVKLWLDNDEGSHYFMREVIEDNWEPEYPWRAGEALRDALADTMPDLSGTMWGDLLNAAWEEVNWTEIATAVAEDLDLDAED